MRLFLSAVLLGTLSFTSTASAQDRQAPATDSFVTAHIPESYALARRLAEGEARLRASSMAAGVLIQSVIGHDDVDSLTVTPRQRDAVLKVLKDYSYLGHLAQMYAAIMKVGDMREAVALYDDARMPSFWKFESAAISAILSQAFDLEVELPESPIAPLSDGEALATRASIEALVAQWFEGVENQIDLDAFVTDIQARTVARDIDEATAITNIPVTAKLRAAQKTQRYTQFDRKELESPRFRNALTNALLLAR